MPKAVQFLEFLLHDQSQNTINVLKIHKYTLSSKNNGKFCLCQHYVFLYLMNQTNPINCILIYVFSISGPRVNLAKMTTSSSPNHNNLELVMTEDPDFIRT